MGTVEYKGKDVAYYERNGEDIPLVFIHGLCEESSLWDDFVKPFDSHRIVSIDIPGFGNSDVIKDLTIEDAAEIVKLVITTLHIKKCILIGHSLGGYISIAFARKYESLLGGMVLFHSHPFEDKEEKKLSRQRDIEFIQKNGHFHYIKQLIPNLFADIFASSNKFLLDSMVHKAATFPPEGIIVAHTMMMRRQDYSFVLRNIRIPVSFIIGVQDKTIPFDLSMAQTHLANIADIHVMPEVAHMGMIRSKEKTQNIVANFIELCDVFGR
jgi:pimeloyl-ACP methyl ester carboxylesterase